MELSIGRRLHLTLSPKFLYRPICHKNELYTFQVTKIHCCANRIVVNKFWPELLNSPTPQTSTYGIYQPHNTSYGAKISYSSMPRQWGSGSDSEKFHWLLHSDVKVSILLHAKIVVLSQADGRLPCVNGDNAIQWAWSNFDPLTESKRLNRLR